MINLKPKVLSSKPTSEPEHEIQETTRILNTVERVKERELQLAETNREKLQAEERAKLALKAPQISKSLGGDFDDRMSQERTLHIRMTLDSRPEVVFTGFWNGKLIQAAQNAVARAYRQRRITVLKQ